MALWNRDHDAGALWGGVATVPNKSIQARCQAICFVDDVKDLDERIKVEIILENIVGLREIS
jgi:hypothetical protein